MTPVIFALEFMGQAYNALAKPSILLKGVLARVRACYALSGQIAAGALGLCWGFFCSNFIEQVFVKQRKFYSYGQFAPVALPGWRKSAGGRWPGSVVTKVTLLQGHFRPQSDANRG